MTVTTKDPYLSSNYPQCFGDFRFDSSNSNSNYHAYESLEDHGGRQKVWLDYNFKTTYSASMSCYSGPVDSSVEEVLASTPRWRLTYDRWMYVCPLDQDPALDTLTDEHGEVVEFSQASITLNRIACKSKHNRYVVVVPVRSRPYIIFWHNI